MRLYGSPSLMMSCWHRLEPEVEGTNFKLFITLAWKLSCCNCSAASDVAAQKAALVSSVADNTYPLRAQEPTVNYVLLMFDEHLDE